MKKRAAIFISIQNQKKVLYKVVGKGHRYGTNMTGYMCDGGLSTKEVERELKMYPELEPFFPRYRKGATVCAVENSVGLLCFEDKYHAKLFMSRYPNLTKMWRVIKVAPLSEYKYLVVGGLQPDCMIIQNLTTLTKHLLDDYISMAAPTGTVVVEKVKVLE